MTAIFDDFDHVTTALRRCETFLTNTRRADDPNVVVGNHDSLLGAVRLELSVISEGSPSTDELEPFIGHNWVVVQRRTKTARNFVGCRGDERQILPREYNEANRLAIEARLPRLMGMPR